MESLARVFVEVYGCSSNQADFEIAQGLLKEAGHTLVGDPALADASVILSCTVKTPTQRKVAKRIRQLSDLKKGLVVAGTQTYCCLYSFHFSLIKHISKNKTS